SLATSRPTSSKPPTTLNQRSSNRNRHQHEAGNEPETVHTARRRLLKVDHARPWATVITTAHTRLAALPVP
ncbi:MAG: hypothetical protein QOI36_4768, partial [Pseudonocardiales bacterium]|nr:hypothetical protein [Pseudonocardiales bacterium]